jgi:large subunit ribosomal protein L24
MNKTRIKKNDTVKVLAGKDKGKTGKVLKIDRKSDRVVVQGVNMVKKAMRKRNQQDKGGIIEIEAPLHISNLAIVTKDGSTSRIGYKFEDGKKVRFAKKTGEVL